MIVGEVYDEAVGLPLAGAEAKLLALDGVAPASPVVAVSDERGRFHFASNPGVARLRITKTGYTAVERAVTVVEGRIVLPFDARLTPLDGHGVLVTSLLGATVSDSKAHAALSIPAFSLADDQQMALTSIGGQGLAGRLPLGWSPLAAVDISPHGLAFAASATLAIPFAGGVPEGAVAARWDADHGQWVALGNAVRSSDGTALQLGLTQTGQVALLLPDAGPTAPPAPVVGELISGAQALPSPATLTATIEPSPRVLFAASDARSQVSVQVTAETPLQSGMAVQIALADRYDFFSGALLAPEPVIQDFALYAYGAGLHTLRAGFVVSPLRPFDPYMLRLGTIDLQARRPQALETPLGTVLPAGGGRVAAPSGAAVTIPSGAGAEGLPVVLSPLTQAEVALDLSASLAFLGGVALDLHGAPLDLPATLSIPAPSGQAAGDQVLVVQLAEANGASHLQLVAVGELQGNVLVSTVDPFGDGLLPLPGISGEGRYLFLRSQLPLGYVVGLAAGSSGQPMKRALVTVDTLSLVSLSAADGRYVLAAPVGAVHVAALDPVTQDTQVQTGQITAKNEVLPLGLVLVDNAPAVTASEPADNAENISGLSTIRVTFSKVIDRASVTSGVLALANASGTTTGTLVLLPGDRVLTFQPQATLRSDTVYTITVSTAIRDLNGRALAAPFVSHFSTVDTTPPLPPAAGALAATIPDATGHSTVTGSQGTAEPEWTVSIRNLTTKALTAVLPESDGSFSVRVPAAPAINSSFSCLTRRATRRPSHCRVSATPTAAPSSGPKAAPSRALLALPSRLKPGPCPTAPWSRLIPSPTRMTFLSRCRQLRRPISISLAAST